MYGEYGYMEEGPLGKAYNLRLLKRLARYALPYKKFIVMALCLTMTITLLNLALPYLSKIAIDRYILASWYRVNLTGLEAPDGSDLLKRVSPLLEKSEDGTFGFITHEDMKNLDPADLQRLRIENIISSKRFYRVRIDARDPTASRAMWTWCPASSASCAVWQTQTWASTPQRTSRWRSAMRSRKSVPPQALKARFSMTGASPAAS